MAEGNLALGEEQISLWLRQFRLSAMEASLGEVTGQARSESWDYLRYLSELCEREAQTRSERRLERLLRQSGLPESKRLENLDPKHLGTVLRRKLNELLEGHFVATSSNVLAFGLPGRGKTHFLCAVARELILRHQISVWFTTGAQLVERLLQAKAKLELEACLRKLDRYSVVIIDDIGYVQHSREEMEVLFTFFAERYEKRSLMISSNLTFSKWDRIFQDPMTAMAAIDRLVHHSIILEFTGESRRKPQGKPPRAGTGQTETIESPTP